MLTFRRWAEDFLAAIEEVLLRGPDVLILHEGPDVP